MIISNYSCLVKDVMLSSWREAIQRPLWQEEDTNIEVLTMKPGLFVSGSKLCKDGVVYSCAPCCLVDPKRLIERQQSESTNGNIGTLSTLAVWMSEMGSEQSYESQRQITFLALFSRSSTRQHDYSSGTQRENAWRHRYKMKPDRRYSAASLPGLITEGHPLLCSALFSFSCFPPCVTSSFHLHLSL